MIRLSFITNGRTPYRKLQFEEFSKISNLKFSIYYTNPKILERKWKVDKISNVYEEALKGVKISEKYGYINLGLKKIVKNSDIVLLGGYEQPTYQLISRLCVKYNKKLVLFSDGISPKKTENQNKYGIKYKLKKSVINKCNAIFGNGEVSKKYFKNNFDYPVNKIFNQYLTVDIDKIQTFEKDKEKINQYYKSKYKIDLKDNIVIYSGRLIKRKNVNLIIKAISNLGSIHLLILGDGEEKQNIIDLCEYYRVNYTITGFIENQEELFKHYYLGDLLILPSYNEPWGLVINEAMAAGLPVICSNECGASLDLVKDNFNGFILNDLENPDILKELVLKTLRNKEKFSINSLNLISEWTFENSRKSFETMIKKLTEFERSNNE